MKLNKGAMFGLDARIALAIFGALSVISGAALYIAIKQSKVVAFATQLEEYSKALEQYVLDTGTEPQDFPDGFLSTLRAEELINSTKEGWNGPYLSGFVKSASSHYLIHPKYYALSIVRLSAAGTTVGSNAGYVDCTATKCDLYIAIAGVPHDLAEDVDEYIDGEPGYNKGKVFLGYGYTGGNAVVNTSVSYKVMPTINK